MLGISFFSVLSWCFFLISVVGAMILTTWRAALVRKYRSSIISVTISCLFLGLVSGSTPYLLKRLNPDESRLVPIDQLISTAWVEPLENPQSELPAEEIQWTEKYSVKFRYKLHLPFSFKQWITAYDRYVVMLDESGSIRGFDAYTGLNHWSIPLQITNLIAFEHQQKRLYILEKITHRDQLRVTCIDLQTPSAVWQRTIPGSSTGGITFNFDSQILMVTAGTSGVWALQGKTGEVLWKRPEIYSTVIAVHAGKYWMIFEPAIAKKQGAWNWIDEQNGKIISKVKHSLLSMGNVTSTLDANQESILAQTITENHTETLERMQKPEFNSLWSIPVTEPIARVIPLNGNHFLVIYGTNLAELRNISDSTIIWQKKLSDVDARWITLTPDQRLFLMPTASNEVQFFDVATGEWQFSAKTSEAIEATEFFGDWFFWVSENQLWAYQKK